MNSMQQYISDVKVTMAERVLSMFTGSALLFYGLRNRGLKGTGVAVVRGGLLARGMTGHSKIYSTLGICTASEEERLSAKRAIRVEKTLTVNAPVVTCTAFGGILRTCRVSWPISDPYKGLTIVAHIGSPTAQPECRSSGMRKLSMI